MRKIDIKGLENLTLTAVPVEGNKIQVYQLNGQREDKEIVVAHLYLTKLGIQIYYTGLK